jgi:hypothetical protein
MLGEEESRGNPDRASYHHGRHKRTAKGEMSKKSIMDLTDAIYLMLLKMGSTESHVGRKVSRGGGGALLSCGSVSVGV